MAFTIHAGETVNGSSRRPTSIEVNETGIAVGAFRRVMNPWSEVKSIEIFGPDSQTSRVTATRLAALGVLAFALKKSTTETLVVVSLKSGGTQNLMFLKKSEPEVRALFSPFISRVSGDSVKTIDETDPNGAVVSHRQTISKTAEIRELVDLFEKGFIDESEFKDLKMSVINGTAEYKTTDAPGFTDTSTSDGFELDLGDEEILDESDSNEAAIVVIETLVDSSSFIYRVSGWSDQDVEELANVIGFFMFDTYFFPQRVLRRARNELRTKKSVRFECSMLDDDLLQTLVNRFQCNVQIGYQPATALNSETREDALMHGKVIDVSPFRELMANYFVVGVGINSENFSYRQDAWNIFLSYGLNVESLRLLRLPGFSHDAFELPLGVPLLNMKEKKSDLMIRELEQIGFKAERFWWKPTQ